MKKILNILLIGAFVFGFDALDIQYTGAAHFNKPGFPAVNRHSYSTKKPEQPNNFFGDRQGHQQRHKNISR